jgi:hypothetical protein
MSDTAVLPVTNTDSAQSMTLYAHCQMLDKYELDTQALDSAQRRLVEKQLEISNPHTLFEEKSFVHRYRQVISLYAKNPVVADAISGRKTVASALEDVIRVESFSRVLLPRTVNGRHNRLVEQLVPLLPDAKMLRTRGVFSPDNATTLGAYMIAMGGIIGAAFSGGCQSMAHWTHDPSVVQAVNEMSQHFVPMGVGLGLLGGSYFGLIIHSGVASQLRRNAAYLDEKIVTYCSPDEVRYGHKGAGVEF